MQPIQNSLLHKVSAIRYRYRAEAWVPITQVSVTKRSIGSRSHGFDHEKPTLREQVWFSARY